MFKNSYFLVWIVKKLALYSLRLVLFLLSWFIFYLIQYVVAWFHQVICPVRPVLRLASLLHFRRLFFYVYFPQMFLFQHSCLERNFGFFCVFFYMCVWLQIWFLFWWFCMLFVHVCESVQARQNSNVGMYFFLAFICLMHQYWLVFIMRMFAH